MADTVDPISATVDLLEAELGDGVPVFGHELPDGQDDAMPRRCVVVSAAGGPGSGGFLPVSKQRLDVRSYGATHAEAMDVAVAAHAVLKPMRPTVVGIVLVRAYEPASGYIGLRDTEARWPLVLRTYLGTFDERPVAA